MHKLSANFDKYKFDPIQKFLITWEIMLQAKASSLRKPLVYTIKLKSKPQV